MVHASRSSLGVLAGGRSTKARGATHPTSNDPSFDRGSFRLWSEGPQSPGPRPGQPPRGLLLRSRLTGSTAIDAQTVPGGTACFTVKNAKNHPNRNSAHFATSVGSSPARTELAENKRLLDGRIFAPDATRAAGIPPRRPRHIDSRFKHPGSGNGAFSDQACLGAAEIGERRGGGRPARKEPGEQADRIGDVNRPPRIDVRALEGNRRRPRPRTDRRGSRSRRRDR